MPKLEFLLESVEGLIKKEEINILDIGAGSGYFVASGMAKDINISGIEISNSQVEFANKMLGSQNLTTVKQEDMAFLLKNTNNNIISAIGVLEHITNLNEMLNIIKENNNIKFLYISVPLFSFSCILEAINPRMFNRHLGGGHTHLFTYESLEWLADHYGFEIVSTWNFGTDIVDLYRFISLELNEDNDYLKEILQKKFVSLIDEIQMILDKGKFCSEIHMVLKKTR